MMMMMMMMMMMITLMKLVNSATKFRHGIDKFYQANSGLRGSWIEDKATYTYINTSTCFASNTYYIWLVVSTPLKNICQLGWLFPIHGKIKHVPNHQPDIYWSSIFFALNFQAAERVGLHEPQPEHSALRHPTSRARFTASASAWDDNSTQGGAP